MKPRRRLTLTETWNAASYEEQRDFLYDCVGSDNEVLAHWATFMLMLREMNNNPHGNA